MKTASQSSPIPLKVPSGAQSVELAVALLKIVAKYNEQGARLSDIARDFYILTFTLAFKKQVLIISSYYFLQIKNINPAERKRSNANEQE